MNSGQGGSKRAALCAVMAPLLRAALRCTPAQRKRRRAEYARRTPDPSVRLAKRREVKRLLDRRRERRPGTWSTAPQKILRLCTSTLKSKTLRSARGASMCAGASVSAVIFPSSSMMKRRATCRAKAGRAWRAAAPPVTASAPVGFIASDRIPLRRAGFVQQRRRLRNSAPRQRHPLALALRQRVRRALGVGLQRL